MESGIDQQIPLEAGDGSQQKHFIIPFINCALRPAGCLCGKGFIFKTSRTLLQHIYHFLHGCQSSLWQNQPMGDRSVQTFDSSALICPSPAAPVSPLFVSSPQSSKCHIFQHRSVFWEPRRARSAQSLCKCVHSQPALCARTWRRLCTFILLC